jgi:hypothetical protein
VATQTVAAFYALASVFIGPFIVFGLGGHVSGFDCSDLSWGDATLAERDAVYQGLRSDVVLATVLMLVVGLAIIVALVIQRAHITKPRLLVLVTAVVTMMAGYASILALSNWLWSCTNL